MIVADDCRGARASSEGSSLLDGEVTAPSVKFVVLHSCILTKMKSFSSITVAVVVAAACLLVSSPFADAFSPRTYYY